jgi:hypothetical protein
VGLDMPPTAGQGQKPAHSVVRGAIATTRWHVHTQHAAASSSTAHRSRPPKLLFVEVLQLVEVAMGQLQCRWGQAGSPKTGGAGASATVAGSAAQHTFQGGTAAL